MDTILAKALGQDVNKLAAREKQLLLSRLLARVAHEIRNPLSSLDIHFQLLEEDVAEASPELRARIAPRFETVRGELHRLEAIVKQFVGLAGSQALDLQPVHLCRIAAHVCELLRPEAARRGIQLLASVPETLPVVLADGVQLTQALVNLVINAIQAVDSEGSVVIQASAEATQERVRLEVRDTGPGIPADELGVVFEPFYTTKAAGSGLGLWIVQQIVTAHGGLVTAANAQPNGTVITLHLPQRARAIDG